jgi:hypothetical protein
MHVRPDVCFFRDIKRLKETIFRQDWDFLSKIRMISRIFMDGECLLMLSLASIGS